MKLNKLIVSSLALLLPLCFPTIAEAGILDGMFSSRSCCCPEPNCCSESNCCSQRDCGSWTDCCNALECGCFHVTPRVGFSPATYASKCKRCISYCSGVGTSQTPNIDDDSLKSVEHKKAFPDFSDMWEYPWQVGLDLAYDLSNCAQVFLDANYTQARGKDIKYKVSSTIYDCGPIQYVITDEFHEDFDDMKEVSGYFGCRYYSPRMCKVSILMGSKVGFRYRNSVEYDLAIRETTKIGTADAVTGDLICKGKHTYFDSQTVVSAGVQLGLDIQINDCCAVVLMGEVVGSGTYCTRERKDNRILDEGSTVESELDDDDILTSRKVTGGNTTTVVNYPVTLGVRLSF